MKYTFRLGRKCPPGRIHSFVSVLMNTNILAIYSKPQSSGDRGRICPHCPILKHRGVCMCVLCVFFFILFVCDRCYSAIMQFCIRMTLRPSTTARLHRCALFPLRLQ